MERIEFPKESRFADNYKIKELLGRGGQAVVYKALDLESTQTVALKIFDADKSRKEFSKEARTQARLHHPNIIPYIWSGVAEGHPYISMKLARHGSYADILHNKGRSGTDASIKHTLIIANAIQFGHEQGILHRDIKPGNILIDAENVYLSDWGIAVRTIVDHSPTSRNFLIHGTPEYSAAEQLDGHPIPASDIYALGITTYELSTGTRPFMDELPTDLIMAQKNKKPPYFEAVLGKEMTPLHDAIEPVVRKALEKKPEDRQRSMGDYAEELRTAYARGKAQEKKEKTIIDTATRGDKTSQSEVPTLDMRTMPYFADTVLMTKKINPSSAITERVAVSDTQQIPDHLIPIPPPPYAEFGEPPRDYISVKLNIKTFRDKERKERDAEKDEYIQIPYAPIPKTKKLVNQIPTKLLFDTTLPESPDAMKDEERRLSIRLKELREKLHPDQQEEIREEQTAPKTVTVGRAKEVLGDNFYGLERVQKLEQLLSKNGKDIRFVIGEDAGVCPFTEEDLNAAKELDEKLMYRPAKMLIDGKEEPITIAKLIELTERIRELPKIGGNINLDGWVNGALENEINKADGIESGWAMTKTYFFLLPNILSVADYIEDYKTKLVSMNAEHDNMRRSSSTEIIWDLLQKWPRIGTGEGSEQLLTVIYPGPFEKTGVESSDANLYLNIPVENKRIKLAADFDRVTKWHFRDFGVSFSRN